MKRSTGQMSDDFKNLHAEFAKYHRLATGRDAPDGLAAFEIDPAISETGNDAYAIRSGIGGKKSDGATITGSNLRSVFYGLYDLLGRRAGCKWFWDGDIVPHHDAIDLAGLADAGIEAYRPKADRSSGGFRHAMLAAGRAA